MSTPIRAVVWNEFVHEKEHEAVKRIYPEGMHRVIAEALEQTGDFTVQTATLEEPEHGLTKKSWKRPRFFTGGATLPTIR